MKQRLKKWEIALAFGVLFSLFWGAGTAHAQAELADQIIRIHVIAHSDTPEDQALKLAVRDAVLEQVRGFGERAATTREMAQLLQESLTELEQAGEGALRVRGCPCPVTASLIDCYFPTRKYEGFALPAGEYTALRLEIGDGAGQNWWCVAFPPLCVGASAQSVEEAAQAGFFTKEQAELISGEGGEYVLQFKSMELLGAIKQFFLGD